MLLLKYTENFINLKQTQNENALIINNAWFKKQKLLNAADMEYTKKK